MPAESERLVQTLKRSLRAQGLTYKDVAVALNLSESSVKRLFSAGALSLDRLAQICALANLSIDALARLAADDDSNASTLSLAQEQVLAQDPMLLTYFSLLLSGWSPQDIEAEYQIDKLKATQLGAALDRVGLVEVQPQEKIRLLTARTIHWRKDGPVRREYERLARKEFLEGSFVTSKGDSASQRSLRTLTGELSDESIEIMERKLDALRRSFEELVAVDSRLEPTQRTGMGLMLAMRPWAFSVFQNRQRRSPA